MGNSVPSNGHLQLGNNVTINFKRAQSRLNSWSGQYEEEWYVKYQVDGSTISLSSTRFLGTDGIGNQLRLQFIDSIRKSSIYFFVIKAENDLLEQIEFLELMGRFYDKKFANETNNTWGGGVTKTDAFFHGSGSKGGLLVVEQKRKIGDMKPYNVTVAHYYAVSQNDMDIGLSMMVDIRVSNDELIVSAEGPPLQHPSSALLYMFREVYRTRTWKRTACPHCAAERSETVNDLLPSRPTGLINNEVIRGDSNGNLIAAREVNIYNYMQQRHRNETKTETRITETRTESEDRNDLSQAAPRRNTGQSKRTSGRWIRAGENQNSLLRTFYPHLLDKRSN